jgi:hypothetical protein
MQNLETNKEEKIRLVNPKHQINIDTQTFPLI